MAPKPQTESTPFVGPTPKTALVRAGFHLKNERFLACSQFVSRPEFGQNGKRIVLNTNHFSVNLNHKKVIYRYNLTIECLPQAFKLSTAGDERRKFRKLSDLLSRKIINKAVDENKSYGKLFYNIKPVYDGSKSMFTCGPIIGISQDGKPTRIVVEVVDDSCTDSQFAVNIKFTGNTISLHGLKLYFDKKTNAIPFEAIQALNIALRQGLIETKVPIGASLFSRCFDDNRINIGGGKQLAFGIYQSLRPCVGGSQLVVDRSCTAFYSNCSVEEFVRTLFPFKECESVTKFKWNDFERKRIERELKGLQIEVIHLKISKKYKIKGLSRESANDIFFEWTKRGVRGEKIFEGKISVAQYFKQEYQELQLPHLPCIVVRGGSRPTYFPIEVCRLVADQHVKKKLAPQQTAEMIRICASTQPKERFDIIQKAAKDIALNNNCLQYLNEFSVKMCTQPISLNARILNAPTLLEKNDKNCIPRDGKWKIGQFYKCAHVNKWIIVNLAQIEDLAITNFIDTLRKYGNQIGMNIDQPVCRVKMTYQRGLLRVILLIRL